MARGGLPFSLQAEEEAGAGAGGGDLPYSCPVMVVGEVGVGVGVEAASFPVATAAAEDGELDKEQLWQPASRAMIFSSRVFV